MTNVTGCSPRLTMTSSSIDCVGECRRAAAGIMLLAAARAGPSWTELDRAGLLPHLNDGGPGLHVVPCQPGKVPAD
jgi:hypothetical protein